MHPLAGGRFHDLSEFEGTKKSCQRKLKRHNQRRRRRVEGEDASPGGSPTTVKVAWEGDVDDPPEVGVGLVGCGGEGDGREASVRCWRAGACRGCAGSGLSRGTGRQQRIQWWAEWWRAMLPFAPLHSAVKVWLMVGRHGSWLDACHALNAADVAHPELRSAAFFGG